MSRPIVSDYKLLGAAVLLSVFGVAMVYSAGQTDTPTAVAHAYKSQMLKCRFDLSSFDLMPEEFLPTCHVEFTMPLATISHTVVRSVSVEQHEDSDRVEKFVRYVAKCHYNVEVDYVQCERIEDDDDGGFAVESGGAGAGAGLGEAKSPASQHVGGGYGGEEEAQRPSYGIELPDDKPNHRARSPSSSSDEEDAKGKRFPMVEINMKGYGGAVSLGQMQEQPIPEQEPPEHTSPPPEY